MSRKQLILATMVGLVGALGWACAGPEHLTESHGKSSRAIFAKQVINPEAGKASIDKLGLDSQEAAIISKTYRNSLQPKDANTGGSAEPQVLLLAPNAGQETPVAPSVPGKR